MDAQVVEVVGQEMVRSEICHHGRDLVGSMDVVRVGTWDIVPVLVL
jgi:hypothetical protein